MIYKIKILLRHRSLSQGLFIEPKELPLNTSLYSSLSHLNWLVLLYSLLPLRSQKRYTKWLMDILSMLFAICGMEDQRLRLAAGETLNKVVKATYLTHITRIQMTAFNEMKKVWHWNSIVLFEFMVTILILYIVHTYY